MSKPLATKRVKEVEPIESPQTYKRPTCPPECKRAGKMTGSCRTHGGWLLCPLDCTANKSKSMQKQRCQIHMAPANRKPLKQRVKKLCPPECPRSGKPSILCREHGGGSLCPLSCTVNKSTTMEKAFCTEHGGCKVCPADCAKNAGKQKVLCGIHGGKLVCAEACPNYGRRRGLCKFGCGGHLLCPADCAKKPFGEKRFCAIHGGQSLCPPECSKNPGGMKCYCPTHGAGSFCQLPCKNHGNRKALCRYGCGGWQLCVSCKLLHVRQSGKMCSDCNPNPAVNSRIREKQMEFTLKQWASEGKIPEYTTWNKEITEADSAACGRNRPDFTFVSDASAIVLEFDEHQHSLYDRRCELVRMANIFLSFRGRRVAFIRYNPDAFKVGGTTLVTNRQTREGVLLEVLKESLACADFGSAIVVHYVCYDVPAGVGPYVQSLAFADIAAYEAWVK